MDRRRFLTLTGLATMGGFASLACNSRPDFIETLLRKRFTERWP